MVIPILVGVTVMGPTYIVREFYDGDDPHDKWPSNAQYLEPPFSTIFPKIMHRSFVTDDGISPVQYALSRAAELSY